MFGNSISSQFTNGQISFGHSRHAHRAEHGDHHHRHAHRGGNNVSIGGSTSTGSAKQVLVNQISIALRQRFELHVSGTAIAGATPDEQASQDLASVVSSALNSQGDTPPTEAVANVNEATDAAIQQTAQDLQPSISGLGLKTAIGQLNNQLQSLYSAFLSHANGSQGTDTFAETGARLISKAKGTLEIHTQEGDTIQLDFSSRTAIGVHNLQASDGITQVSGTDFHAFSKSRVTLSVQGNLNADELQAVQDLVGQINQLASGFFSGDASAPLSGLNFDGTQLADYSLNLALKQRFAAYGLSLSLPPAAETAAASEPASDAVAALTPPSSDQTTDTATQDGANEPPQTAIAA